MTSKGTYLLKNQNYLVLLCVLISLAEALPTQKVSEEGVLVPHVREKRQFSGTTDRYGDAKYAGQFAKMLESLESQNKNMYIDFIRSGFTGNEIPRELPEPMKSLSRFSSSPLGLHSGPSASFRTIGPLSTLKPISESIRQGPLITRGSPFRTGPKVQSLVPARSLHINDAPRGFRFPGEGPRSITSRGRQF